MATVAKWVLLKVSQRFPHVSIGSKDVASLLRFVSLEMMWLHGRSVYGVSPLTIYGSVDIMIMQKLQLDQTRSPVKAC